MVTGLTLLHTSPLHVPVFDALRDRDHPGAALDHVVVPELLDGARRDGPESVAPALRALLADSRGPVLVTCSSIGAVAESLAGELGVSVLRAVSYVYKRQSPYWRPWSRRWSRPGPWWPRRPVIVRS